MKRFLFACAAGAVFVPVPSWAQTPPRPASPATWEIEATAGVSLGRAPSGGTLTLPDPGAPIVSTSPAFSSHRVPTWFLGDGASMVNDVLSALGATSRIVPLETGLTGAGVGRATSTSFGGRVRRRLTSRISIEGSVDVLHTAPGLPHAFLTAAEASRASFESAFTSLFQSGPFSGTTVSATSVSTTGSGHELAITGAAIWRLRAFGHFAAYTVTGGGMLREIGTPASLDLTGTYSTHLPSSEPIHETDHVTVRSTIATIPVAVVGGGLRRDLANGWGLSIDARVLLGRNASQVLVSASPTVATATPAGFIESVTSPGIQFSNNPSTGRESSLGAPALSNFAVFTGTGLTMRVIVTIGVNRRF